MIWELLERTSKIGVSEIKSPVGSLYQKYVYSSQDEDHFWIFWALLVQFGFGIMHQEGFWELLILGFLRSKSSNLEVWKIWGTDVKMALYLKKYKNLVKEVC